MNERDGGRGDAGDAAGLADGDGADALELFSHLAGEATDDGVIESCGNGVGFRSFHFFD